MIFEGGELAKWLAGSLFFVRHFTLTILTMAVFTLETGNSSETGYPRLATSRLLTKTNEREK